MIVDRRGFTLVELMVVAVLGMLVLMAALQILITNQRTYTAQAATIQGQQSTRMALDVLFNELRETSPTGGDILAMSSDSIRVRLPRKFSIVCAVDLSVPKVTVINIPEYFDDPDSVFVFADNDEDTDDDDYWIPAEVTAADTLATCLSQPATDVEFSGQTAAFVADSVRVGAPIRSFQTFTFGLTNALGEAYLGRRSGAGAMIPVAGPLKASTGLEFVYLDALGAVTAVPADVRQILVNIRTASTVMNSVGRTVSDSITAWIYTRN